MLKNVNKYRLILLLGLSKKVRKLQIWLSPCVQRGDISAYLKGGVGQLMHVII